MDGALVSFLETCGTVLIFFSAHSAFLLKNCRKTCKEMLHVIVLDFWANLGLVVLVKLFL